MSSVVSDHTGFIIPVGTSVKVMGTNTLTAPKARYAKCMAAAAPAGFRVHGSRALFAHPTGDLDLANGFARSTDVGARVFRERGWDALS